MKERKLYAWRLEVIDKYKVLCYTDIIIRLEILAVKYWLKRDDSI